MTNSLPPEGGKSQACNSVWVVTCVLPDRTSIVNPPEDRVVIKGTTATLHCGATHDPRITLRSVQSLTAFGAHSCSGSLGDEVEMGESGQLWFQPQIPDYGITQSWAPALITQIPFSTPALCIIYSELCSTPWLQYSFSWFFCQG